MTEGQAFYTHTDGRRQWEHPAPPAEETPPETDDAEKPADVKPTNAAVASKEEEEVPLQHCCHTTATPGSTSNRELITCLPACTEHLLVGGTLGERRCTMIQIECVRDRYNGIYICV